MEYKAQNLVIGGGIAGLVTALELLDCGQTVVLVDRDSRERLGGLALWAFGGMALIDTPEQRRMGVKDSPELALEDWIRFGELTADQKWPLAWARCYVEESRTLVYEWLKSLGLKFMPAVNLVERGESIKGNSVARYHILWGTGRVLVETIIQRLLNHANRDNLKVLYEHRATQLLSADGITTGCQGIDERSGQPFSAWADNTIVASGGINGSVEQVRKNWPPHWPEPPRLVLNGANPLSDGAIHQAVAQNEGRLTNLQNMWNYAAGIPHPQPQFDGHGLSLIPCKSGLWLSPDGQPIGPAPMVTGFDTRQLCKQVAEYPYTWQVLNWKIAIRELAISGSEHNLRILKHQLLMFLKETLLGNNRLLRQMFAESGEFIAADDWPELADKMNRLSNEDRIDGQQLQALAAAYDRALAEPSKRSHHPHIQRIEEVRQWRTDKLRTCKLQAIGQKSAGPLIAIRLHFISRKSLGGIQTDLQGRVLSTSGAPLPGLYAVGEAAGFGGGGASGKRSLEGTFLSGCILTARKTAAAICQS
jgi:predicted oxidoreductase